MVAMVADTARHAAVVSQIEEYCFALGGTKPIHSILIANNGMAAVKFIRSIRMWAYETFGVEKLLSLVAMATPEDMRINAEHIRMADQFIEVPGGTNNNNYANVQLIVEIAERTGVTAVWPGWGHASEVPDLPEQLEARGIVFLGPPAAPMAALGDKIGSSIIAQAAGVPTLAWSGSDVHLPFEKCKEAIPEDLYKQACVHTTEEALSSCEKIGYPVMIKASWGGGGKGIRKVNNDDEVRALFKQVQGEVPGSPIFIMKLATQSRHLEVQLLADKHGNVTSLHSRDCSIQRRHQKIIEEGPITIAPPETIKALEQGACRLAKSVNYVGAGTVEYLFSMETGEYCFLELNPRLQVEHPVTEWIADVNIPAAQLCVGMGIPLWRMPEIRRLFGKDLGGGNGAWRKCAESATPFDFVKAESCKPRGHVVAVRVTSEDPDDGFKPTSGQVQELSFRSQPNVWAYFSVKSGGGIHEFSDSQFGHVFAYGETRSDAIANMALGLKELHIRGEIRTSVDYTVDLLHAPDYRDNKIHTGWLDLRIASRVRVERPPWHLSVVGGAVYKGTVLTASGVLDYIGYLEKGQVPPKSISLVNFQVSLNIEGSKYTVDMRKAGPGNYRLRLNQSEVEAEVHKLRDGGLLVQLDGNSHVVYAEEEASGTRLLIDGRPCLLQNEHDPSRLIAETPCKLMRYLVADGSHVGSDVPYAEVEVMKMCMPMVTPASGTIHCTMTEGSTMMPGDLVASLDLDDPSAVKKAEPFEGTFPPLGPPTAVAAKVHQRCAATINAANNILAGYENDIEQVVQTLLSCLDDPQLPLLQWQEWMAVLGTRLPKELKTKLDAAFDEYEVSFNERRSNAVEFPAKSLRAELEASLTECPEKEKGARERLLEPLLTLVSSYEGGRESHACSIVQSFFERYLSVEEFFSQDLQADVIENLRRQYIKDLPKVVDIVLSHQGVRRKNVLISRLMGALVYPNPAAYREQLIRFAELNHITQSELALRSSQLLEQTKLSELRSNIARSLSELEMFTEDGGEAGFGRRRSAIEERIQDLVDAPLAVEDALVALFDHSDHTLQRRVVETYVRRLYQPYLVKGSLLTRYHRSGIIASWQYIEESPQQATEKSFEPNGAVESHGVKRWGAMVILTSLHFLSSAIGAALKETGEASAKSDVASNDGSGEIGNIFHVALVGIKNQMSALQDSGDEDQAQERVDKLGKALKSESLGTALLAAEVGLVSCIIQRDEGRTPTRHCFKWSPDSRLYEEEPLLRHVEPPLCNLLELDFLKGFINSSLRYAPSRDRQWQVYYVTEKPSNHKRLFLRTLLRVPRTSNDKSELENATEQAELAMLKALDELELTSHDSNNKADHVHMFLSVLRPLDIGKYEENSAEGEHVMIPLRAVVHDIYSKLGPRMHRLAVAQWEIRLRLTKRGSNIGAWRINVINPTANTCTIQVYKEVKNANLGSIVYHSPSPKSLGPLHGKQLDKKHKPLDAVDRRRLTARRNNTTYVYDFPLVFETALRHAWTSSGQSYPEAAGSPAFQATEVIFADNKNFWNSPLKQVERPVASNDVGMVAWQLRMRTPEFPEGRIIFVVSNDVTYNVGSFGQREDAFFKAVTDLAIRMKVPLIYLAANSGARIGVADEVRSTFKVGWSDESSPDRGFQYLYLTPEDYNQLGTASVRAHEIQLPSGEVRFVIDDIIGKEDGLGVENLSGSGAIAGVYSKAYQETFTLTYVSGRTVGIGAYLARLGMRCIQRLDQPIILTGFPALNKLLGREVYSSHMQLGGPKVMAVNGVVHLTVVDDLEGVSSILNWLSYIPARKGGRLPIIKSVDPKERLVEYNPENTCDPRAAIRGVESNGKWLGGIFDKGSFVETLAGWAQTVVTGRARLGGIPVGIVAVETQTVMQTVPADPGQPDSAERVVPQAGQVWFPDSASKTAMALLDFNKEGLPLFILANWRGFSGGQRDLFEGILQAGSLIVEHLRTYEQPVFVFIPKTGELRGGAWVVVDSKINTDQVEMYAERTAKGGVLEPEGLIEIKFRSKEMIECMHRLDPKILSLKQKHQQSDAGAAAKSIQQEIKAREKQLLPVYKQIAVRFAELHDTANRMEGKGVIKKVVDWSQSRYFFHRRLKRRLTEEALAAQVQEAGGPDLSHADALELIKTWFKSAQSKNAAPAINTAKSRAALLSNGPVADAWEDNSAFVAWGNQPDVIEANLQRLREERVSKEILALASTSSGNLKALPGALQTLLQQVDASSREQAVHDLKQVLESLK